MKYSKENSPLVCMQTTSRCYKRTYPMTVKGILWHSTGCNNTTIRRYVQPSDDAPDRAEMLKIIGTNYNKNDWNHTEVQAGLNAWIGTLANGEVATVQTMPWNYRPWGCGSGPNGSCNDGWIQFEICEDNLNNKDYFIKVYKEACELTAYLCKQFGLDPKGTVNAFGKKVPVILCHKDSNKLGLGSDHGDVLHWFTKYGKTMDDVRRDVAALMAPPQVQPQPVTIPQQEDDEDMTQEKFNEMMNNYLTSLAEKEPSSWSSADRQFCEEQGLIKGDEKGRKMYKKFVTREELAALLHRFHEKGL